MMPFFDIANMKLGFSLNAHLEQQSAVPGCPKDVKANAELDLVMVGPVMKSYLSF